MANNIFGLSDIDLERVKKAAYDSGYNNANRPTDTAPNAGHLAGKTKPSNDQGFFGDTVDALQQGAYQSAAGLAETGHQITGSEFLGNSAQWLNQQAQAQTEQMSPEGQSALQKQFFKEDEEGKIQLGDAWTDPRAIVLNLGNLAGQFVVQLPAGAGVGAVGTKIAGSVLAKTAAKQAAAKGLSGEAAKHYAQNFTKSAFGTAGQAIAGAGVAGGMVGLGLKDELLSMDDSEWNNIESYKRRYWQLAETHPELEVKDRKRMAKNELASEASAAVQRDPALIVTNLALDAVGGHYLDNLLRGVGSGSRLVNAPKQFGIQGLTEGGQGAMERYAQNRAIIDEGINPDLDPMNDVLVSGLNEGAVGGIFGGIGGAVRKGRTREQIARDTAGVNQEQEQTQPAIYDPDNPSDPNHPDNPNNPNSEFQQQQQQQEEVRYRGRYRGIDDDIWIAERIGDDDAAALFAAAKRNYDLAERFLAEGNREAALRFRERGNRAYEEASGGYTTEERAAQVSGNMPVVATQEGEFIGRGTDIVPSEPQAPKGGVTIDADGNVITEQGRIGRDERLSLEHSPSRGLPSPDDVDAPIPMGYQRTQEQEAAAQRHNQALTQQQGSQPPLREDAQAIRDLEDGGAPQERPSAWRTNEILAKEVARGLGMDLDGLNNLRDIVAAIDVVDSTRDYMNVDRTAQRQIQRDKQSQEAVDRLINALAQAQGVDTKDIVIKGQNGTKSQIKIDNSYHPVTLKLVDLDENPSLRPSIKKGKNQFRDRTRKASDVQIAGIAANLDFNELNTSPRMTSGAPTLTREGAVVGGNGRLAAIERAYNNGTAQNYRADLEARAAEFGLTPEQVKGMKRPVLIRQFDNPVDTSLAAIKSQDSGTMGMSELEQAAADAHLMSTPELGLNDDGSINWNANKTRIATRGFAQALPESKRSTLVKGDGTLSPQGQRRFENMLFAKAYGDSDALESIIEGKDDDSANIKKALVSLAPKIAEVRYHIDNGNLHNADITDELVQAIELLESLRSRESTVEQYKLQSDVFGRADDITIAIAEALEANIRSSKDLREIISSYYDNIIAAGEPNQGALFGETAAPTKENIVGIQNGREATDEQARPSIKLEQAATPEGNADTEAGRTEPTIQQSGNAESAESLAERQVIRNNAGKPFKNKGAATLALRKNPDYEVVEVDGGFELHPIPEGAINTGSIIDAPRTSPTEVNQDLGPDANEDFDLLAQSEEELAQQEQEREQREAEEKAKQDAIDRKAKEEQDTRSNKQQADATLDDFALGQDAEQQMTGMNDMFAEPKSTEVDDAASEADTSPTEAQKEAGNYKKGHVNIQGLDISIENAKGSERSGIDQNGKPWSVTMNNHYGYIKRTEGADGDHVDVFIGNNPESDKVFIVDQVNPDGSFDEHKVMLGFDDKAQAITGYKSNYSKGWKVGDVTQMSMDEFKAWLNNGDTTKPVAKTGVRTLTNEGRPTDGKPIKAGDVFSTASGRTTTPYPHQKSARYASQWLIDNAVAEAESRGDELKAKIFSRAQINSKGHTAGEITSLSEKDDMLEYLFGEQPEVQRKILKELDEDNNNIASKHDFGLNAVIRNKDGVPFFVELRKDGKASIAPFVKRKPDIHEDNQIVNLDDYFYFGEKWDDKKKKITKETDGTNMLDEIKSTSLDDIAGMFDEVADNSNAVETDKPKKQRSVKSKAKPTPSNPKPKKIKPLESKAEKINPENNAEKQKLVKDIVKDIGVNLGDAGLNAIDGLAKLFGGNGTLNSGLSFNEETYAKAKPHFIQAAKSVMAAGKGLRDLIQALVNAFGTGIKPYVLKFAEEVQTGEIDLTNEGTSNETDSPSNLEQGSGNESSADTTEGMVSDTQGQREGSGQTNRQDSLFDSREDGLSEQGTSSLFDSSTTADAERGNIGNDNQGEQGGTTGSTTRGNRHKSGGDTGNDGIPPNGTSTEAVTKSVDQDVRNKLEQQKKAEGTPTKRGDIGNIREALPYLQPAQQDDVLKIEQRFAKPDGYGMLITNGTGTGKTFSGLGVVKRYANEGKNNILIVVPDEKIAQDWIESGKPLNLKVNKLKDTKDAGNGIVVTTYANLGDNNEIGKREFDLVVADEAHKLMQSESANKTKALEAVRALTKHPEGYIKLSEMRHSKEVEQLDFVKAKIKDLQADIRIANQRDDTLGDALAAGEELAKFENEKYRLTQFLSDKRKEAKAEIAANQKEKRPRLLALTATPFSYVPNIDWANGYLFDYNEGRSTEDQYNRNYNDGDNRSQFFITNFGYRMRYNRLTRPDEKVDVGLMERQFNERLRKEGALSGRTIDVPFDYDRRFILIKSKVGERIDDALQHIQNSTSGSNYSTGYRELQNALKESFDYLKRRFLLEGIKAREAIPIVKEHLKLGRKVVVFHDYKKGGVPNPFRAMRVLANSPEAQIAYDDFAAQFPDLVGTALEGIERPVEVFKKELPQTLIVNGDENKADILARYKKFQSDESGPQVMLVQSAKNAGWSGHDTTGKHQRVLINLGLPTTPSTSIQQEGRIYRVGQASNAIQRYMNTGTNWERTAFATTIAQRSGTVENLSMGNQARALKQSFIDAFEDADSYPPGHEGEGIGGKENDSRIQNIVTPYDEAKSYYFGQAKRNSRNKSQEGEDYFATPEPIGLKMVEFLSLKIGESSLEPSAGHGAIGRWLPEHTKRTFIEPSNALRSRLSLLVGSNGDRVLGDKFEDLNVINKYDGIAMNPPFGTGGKLAAEHVAKAMKHLKDGGRIVALIPEGPAADKRFSELLSSEETADQGIYQIANISLPSSTFERAGTRVKTRIVVLEKNLESDGRPSIQNINLSQYGDINELFDAAENIQIAERPEKQEAQKEAAIETPKAKKESAPVTGGFKVWDGEHTKTKEKLYLAAPNNQLDREQYLAAKNLADEHGGFWDRYSKGFRFESEQKRQEFIAAAAKNDSTENPMFSRTTGSGMKKSEAEKAANKALKGKSDKITIVQSYQDLPNDVKNAIEAGGDGDGDFGALHYKGHSYIVADYMGSAAEVEAAIFHEHYAHGGLKKLYGAELGRKLDDLLFKANGTEGIRKLAKKQGIDLSEYERALSANKSMDTQTKRRILMEELLAHSAHATGTLKRKLEEVIGAIRQWLRDNGYANLANLRVSDIAYTLKQAREAQQASKLLSNAGIPGPTFKGLEYRAVGDKEAINGQRAQAQSMFSRMNADNAKAREPFSKYKGAQEIGRKNRSIDWIVQNLELLSQSQLEGALYGQDLNGDWDGIDSYNAKQQLKKYAKEYNALEKQTAKSGTSILDTEAVMPMLNEIANNHYGIDYKDLSAKLKDTVIQSFQENGLSDYEINSLAGTLTSPEQELRDTYDQAKESGKTKLTYNQWRQIKSWNFEQWFGNSKVTDRNGEPLVVYHGSPDVRGIFKGGFQPSQHRGSVYFAAKDYDTADSYADDSRAWDYQNAEPQTIPLYLSIKNPLIVDAQGKHWRDTEKYVEEAKAKGHDGIIIKNSIDFYGSREGEAGKPTDVYAWFEPSQAKSAVDEQLRSRVDGIPIENATGNNGDFDPNNPDIRFSRINRTAEALRTGAERAAGRLDEWANTAPEIPSDWTAEQQSAAGKFDTFRPKQPFTDRLKTMVNLSKDKLAQKIFDQFDPLRKLSIKAYQQAHLSRATEGALEALATKGVPFLKDGAIAVRTDNSGFIGAMTKLGDMGEVRKALMWIAANRADKLMGQGRENLFTQEEIDGMKAFATGTLPDGRSRAAAYGQVAQELRKYNKAVLDIAEEAGLINPEGRATWEDEFYIPFYRILEDENGKVSDRYSYSDARLVRQQVIRQLKGGQSNLGDPLENIMANWSSLLGASMRNMAANEALTQGQEVGVSAKVDAQEFASGERGDTWTMQNGQRTYWHVADPMVVEALEAMNFNGYQNGLMKAAGKFKRMMTIGVTYSPTFRIRSLIRDTLHSMAVADVGYNPIANAIRGFKMSSQETELAAQLMAGGGAVRFGSFNEGEGGIYLRKMIEAGINEGQILNTADKLKNFLNKFHKGYQELGDRAETVSRAIAYERAYAKTGSHLEASFAARDIMNYTSMGSAAIIRAMAQVLPFFNARLQGMNKLGRGAAENPKRFMAVVGTIGVASALLFLMNKDDEDYKALPDFVRDTYWAIKVGGNWVYIPKPFEVGSLATVIERFTELAVAGDDYKAKDLTNTLASIMINQLSMNPVPQIMLPLVETGFNYDMFRQRPIDSMAMERLLPEDRFNANTSSAAIAAGKALKVSPQKLEHIVRGYFGWIGTQALNVSDILGRSLVDRPESAKWDLGKTNNMFIIGDFLKEEGTTPSKYSTRFYDLQREINQIYATASAARKAGDQERYKKLMSDPKMKAHSAVKVATRKMTKLNQRIKLVVENNAMSASEKSERLQNLYKQREQIAKQIDQLARSKGIS